MTRDTLDALRAQYPPAKERALRKQLDVLAPHCRRFVAMSPFVVLATKDQTRDEAPPESREQMLARYAEDL
jgi:predicted pyridoxine 5'-phosphate oxidase superfamily flavin-nucleotide-binding protein